MPIVEGFGDEVILLFSAFLAGIILVLTWMLSNVDFHSLVPNSAVGREWFFALIDRLQAFINSRFREQQQLQDSDHPSESLPSTEEEIAGDRVGESELQSAGDLPPHDGQSCEREFQQPPLAERQLNSSHRLSGDSCIGSCNLSQSNSLLADAPSTSALNETSEALSSTESISSSPEQPDTLGSPELPGNQTSFGCLGSTDGNTTGVPPGHVQIRLQYIDGRQRIIAAKLDDTVGEFKRNHFSTELSGRSIVRFVMGGQELRDDSSTLRSYRVSDGSVIHCLVTQARVDPVITTTDSHHFEIGSLMLPLFGFLLTLLWYARIAYRYYFSGASTCSLVAISFLYVIALIGSFRSHRVNRPHQD